MPRAPTPSSTRWRWGWGSIGSAGGPASSASARRRASGCPARRPGPSSAGSGRRRRAAPDVFTGELAQAGIGQNVVAVTPLQLLNAYAAVANGGHLMRPMIVRGETDGQRQARPSLQARGASGDLDASQADLQTMRIGAREVITTGHADQHPRPAGAGGVDGKTGTAEFGRRPPGRPPLPLMVRGLPAVAGGSDGRRPGDRDLLLLGGGAAATCRWRSSSTSCSSGSGSSRTCGSIRASSAWWRAELMGAAAVTATFVDNRKARRWRAFDWQLLLYLVLLVGFGMVMGYSAELPAIGGGAASRNGQDPDLDQHRPDPLLRRRQHRLPLAADVTRRRSTWSCWACCR